MNHNIACCYLTHNHPSVVKEVLEIVKDYYDQNGIDIYVYDSSTNKETKEIVQGFIDNGVNNLFYIPINEKIGGDGKLLEIFKGTGLKKKYDYIWPNKDRSYVTKKTAQAIQRESTAGYDCIFNDCYFPLESERKKYKKIYEKEEFFSEFGWLTTSWDTVLINTQKVLDKICWEEFEKKYDVGIQNNFNQVMVIFGGFSDLARIRVIYGDEAGVLNSKQVASKVTPSFVEIWGKKWPTAIQKLPECYRPYMKKVIKDIGKRAWILGSLDRLIPMVENGILTEKNWKIIKENWTDVSDISIDCAEAIVNKKYGDAIQISFNDFNKAIQNEEYDSAYEMINKNRVWEILLGKKIYWMLWFCFEIYLQEVRSGKKNGIMWGVKDYKDIVFKYQTLKYYVRRLEYEIASEENGRMVDFIKSNRISSEFLGNVIERECINILDVVEKWESISLHGE